MPRAFSWRRFSLTVGWGTIQRLTPVTGDSEPDQARQVIYIGQTQLMTRGGPLPLSFEIPAKSLSEAAQLFNDGAGQAVTDAVKRIEEMQRDAASSIIVPGAEGAANIKIP